MNAADPVWRPRHNPWLIALVVTLAAFMEVLDTTIVNVSLPHIAGSLSSSYDNATWALTSYLIANGIVLTVSGWIASRIGRKRYFLICVITFTLTSLLCGLSQNLPQLIVFRLLQGLSGGGLQPNQQSIILDTFPPARRGAAFGMTAIATVVAPILGPTVGGIITDDLSWRWVFFLNVPVGILAAFAIAALVEDPPWARARPRSVDYIGFSLISLGLGSLQIVLDRGEDADWFGSPFIRVMAIAAAVGLLGAVMWLLSARRPVVDLFVLSNRDFAVGSMMMSVMAIILYSSAVLIPQLSQEVLGYDATHAGLVLSPGGFAIVLLIPLVGRLMKRVQTRLLVATGFTIMGLAFIYSSRVSPDVSFGTLVTMRAAQAAGLAFLFVPISTAAYATMPRDAQGDATALFTLFRNLFGSIGISISTALVTSRTQVHSAYLARYDTVLHAPFGILQAEYTRALEALGYTAAAAQRLALGRLYQVLRTQAAVSSYTDVFIVCATLAFAAVPLAFLFSATKGGRGPAVGAH
ncbi:MAG: DHA2 family efflux MFS transporter permease subunit [Steroidobacteraceae bacterium]